MSKKTITEKLTKIWHMAACCMLYMEQEHLCTKWLKISLDWGSHNSERIIIMIMESEDWSVCALLWNWSIYFGSSCLCVGDEKRFRAGEQSKKFACDEWANKHMNSYNNKFIRIVNKHYISINLVVLFRQTCADCRRRLK